MTIEDDYAWLRDPGYPEVKDEEVLAYLEAENACFEAAMEPHAELVETLFKEMKGRIKEDDNGAAEGRRLALLEGVRGRRAIRSGGASRSPAAPTS